MLGGLRVHPVVWQGSTGPGGTMGVQDSLGMRRGVLWQPRGGGDLELGRHVGRMCGRVIRSPCGHLVMSWVCQLNCSG